MAVRLIQALGLAYNPLLWVLGGLRVWSSMSCCALVHLVAVVCFELKYQWDWLWLSVTGQDFQDKGNKSRNIFVSWHLLVGLIWRIRSGNSPPSTSLLEDKDFSLLLVEHEDSVEDRASHLWFDSKSSLVWFQMVIVIGCSVTRL